MTEIAEVTSASPIEEGAGEQATQLPNDRRNRKGSGLDSMVLAELKQLASSLGIKGTGAMRKSQLIDAIRTAQGRASVPPAPDGTRQDNGSQGGSQGGESGGLPVRVQSIFEHYDRRPASPTAGARDRAGCQSAIDGNSGHRC